MLLYVKTFITLSSRWCTEDFWERKRIGAPAPTLLFCAFAFALLLRSGCRYELINEPPLIYFCVQILNVLQVKSERHHFLTPCAFAGVLSAGTLFLLFFILLFHLHYILCYYHLGIVFLHHVSLLLRLFFCLSL